MAGKQVTELDALPSFTDNSLLPVHNGAGLKKGLLSQLASYLGTKFSNPNLLINPNFKINQRGATSYEQQGYSVDRWKIWKITVTPSTNGGITIKSDKYTETGTFLQYLENATEGDITLSCYVTSVSGTVIMVASGDSQVTDNSPKVVLKQGLNVLHTSKNTGAFIIFLDQGASVTLNWVKLEQGTVATPFVAPNPAEELTKCCRFFQNFQVLYSTYGVASQHYYQKLPLVTPFRSNPTVSITEQYMYNVSSRAIEWRTDGGMGWLNLDLVATNNSQTVCQMVCACDAEIY